MSIITNKIPETMDSTPLSISIYSVTKEATHYHQDQIELIFCLKGSVSVILSYEIIALHKGQILCVNCSEVHGIFSEEDNLLVSFHIHMTHSLFRDSHFEHIMLKVTPDVAGENQRGHLKKLNDLLLAALYLYSEDYDIPTPTFTEIAEKIVALLIKHFNVFCMADYDADVTWSKDRFEQMLLYINMHYSEKLTLKMLSEMEHLNYNYLSTYFNHTFNDTFNNYLSVIRVYHSELRLLSTDDTISAVSYDCGFSAPKFYYKAFKKWYHVTPMEHRKRHLAYNDQSRPNRVYHVNEIYHRINQYITYYFSKSQFDSFGISLAPFDSLSPKAKTYPEWRIF